MIITPDQKHNVQSPNQQRSSPSVSVSWLNVNQVRGRLRQAVERLVWC